MSFMESRIMDANTTNEAKTNDEKSTEGQCDYLDRASGLHYHSSENMERTEDAEVVRIHLERLEKDSNVVMKQLAYEKECLQADKDKLNVEIGEQADKIQQLTSSNLMKDHEIKNLETKLEELQLQKRQLESQLRIMKDGNQQLAQEYRQQSYNLRKVEFELAEIKTTLKNMKENNEKQTQLLKAEFKAELKAELKAEFDDLKAVMKKQTKYVLNEVKKSQEPKVNLNAAQNVQIAMESHGKNVIKREIVKPAVYKISMPKK